MSIKPKGEILFGILLLSMGLFDLFQIHGVSNWVKVEAVINSVDQTHYNPEKFLVTYSYSFENRLYKSNQYTVGILRKNHIVASESNIAHYKKDNKHIMILVNPNDPVQAVLKNGSVFFSCLLIFLGLAGLMLGIKHSLTSNYYTR